VENRHLGADVIDHEGILAELHFDAELFLYEIHVTKRTFGKWGGLVTGFVKLSWVFARNFAMRPTFWVQFSFKAPIQRCRTIKNFARHGFFLLAFLVLRKKQQQHHRSDRRCVASSLLGVARVPVR
jgi:hypothetical protein